MGAVMLDDILVTPLSKIDVVGGNVMHCMRANDSGYLGFGEAYFSFIKPGAIKAWKRHTQMTMNIIVPIGMVRFVFFITNSNGTAVFREENIGKDKYVRITVPPGIWFGFKGISLSNSLILNIASIPHDPLEVERLSLDKVSYAWRQ